MFKIIGGTRPSAMLCNHCAFCTVMNAEPEGNDKRYCNNINKYITIKVVQCSAYRTKEQPLRDMQLAAQAVILNFDFKNNPVWTKQGKRYGARPVRTRRRVAETLETKPVVQ